MKRALNEPLNFEELLQIRKAYEANPGITDIKDLVDGAALSMQFLDATMVSMVAGMDDFRFLKRAPKRSVNQVLAEYNKRKSVGDNFYRTSYVGQTSDPHFSSGYLKRMYDEMVYLSEGFEFSNVLKQTNNVQNPEVEESNSAMLRLLTSFSTTLWHGDKTQLSVESDGFRKKIEDLGAANVYDCRGKLPDQAAILEFAARIRTGYFGEANEFWLPYGSKHLYDQQSPGNSHYIFQDIRADSGVVLSKKVRGIACSSAHAGEIVLQPDLFIDDSLWGAPEDWDRDTDTLREMSVGESPPAMPTVTTTAVAGPVPGSLWTATETPRYRVVARSGEGASVASVPSTTVTVNAGDVVTISIVPGSGGDSLVEEFILLRETAQGSNLFFKIARIKPAAAGPTGYTDLNENLPGCSIGVLGDFNSRSNFNEHRTFVISELMPPLKTVFPAGVRRLRMKTGMVEYYVVPQIFAPEKFVLFKNLPVR